MAEAAPDDGDSMHIIQLTFDIMHYSDHRKYDKQIRKLLQDPVNQHLRYPKSRRDYFGLVKIIIEKYDLINDREESHFKTIEAKYTGDNVSDEVFKDFKTMIDICLVYGRFRDIRILCELNTHPCVSHLTSFYVFVQLTSTHTTNFLKTTKNLCTGTSAYGYLNQIFVSK